MSNLKVGTKVRIRTDLIAGRLYGEEYFVDTMEIFLGVEAEILETPYPGAYNLIGDKDEFFWTPEMFDVIQ